MKHLLLMKLKDGVDKAEFARMAYDKLSGLTQEEDISNLYVYSNRVDRPDNFDVMVEFTVESEATVFRYVQHPLHKEFIAYAAPLVDSKKSFDYQL